MKSVTFLLVLLVTAEFILLQSCSKIDPPENQNPNGPYGHLIGYYKVTEREYDMNNLSDSNRAVFTGRVYVENDSTLIFQQSDRKPTSWWTTDFYGCIKAGDTINCWPSTSIKGRIISQNTNSINYVFGGAVTMFRVFQTWEKLQNPADSAAYTYQFPGDIPGIVKPVAGIHVPSGSSFPSGDGGPAVAANLNYPLGIAIDYTNNIFVTESGISAVRKINSSGIISRFAGNNSSGYSGDGGAATNAQLNSPMGITCDASGNVYIGDVVNRLIRKVNSNGVITTIAGIQGQSGFGEGPAISTRLGAPVSMVTDAAGNIFYADPGQNRIMKLSNTGYLSNYAGTGMAGFAGDGGMATAAKMQSPYSVCFDINGNMLIADRENHRIRKISTNGIITTVAGIGGFSPPAAGNGGLATQAAIPYPISVAVDANNNIYVADVSGIRIIYPNGIINQFAYTRPTKWGLGPDFVNWDYHDRLEASVKVKQMLISGNILYFTDENQRLRKIIL